MKIPTLSEMRYKKLMLVLCFLSYGMFGLFLGMRTNIFHFIQRDYLDAYTHIASLILVSGVLMQLALYSAGPLSERFGFHRILMLGLAASAVSLALMFFVDSALFFDFTYFFFMAGFGIAMLSLNLFVSHLVPERRGNALLLLHLFFSIGALIGPGWISFLTGRGTSWQRVTTFSTAPMFIILIVMLVVSARNPGFAAGLSVPGKHPASDTKERGLQSLLRDPVLWLFVAVFLCSQIWEYGIGTWYVIFANKTHGLSSSEAALYLSLFYACYPPVRIIFSVIIHRLNILAVLLGAFLCCIFFGGLGILTGRLVFYSLTGIGIALMYPGIMAAMQQVFGSGSTRKISFITMAGGMIQYAAIWSVGIISNRSGIGFGFNFMLIYMIFGSAAVFIIMRISR